ATDPDIGNVLTFSMLSASHPGALALNTSTGTLSVANAAELDHEANPTLTLQIRVQDDTGLSNVQTVSIQVLDVNEPPTALMLDNAVSPLLTGKLIGTVSALDPDLDETLTFSLLDDVNGSFVLDATDGSLRISDNPNIAPARDHTITVIVTDSAGNRFSRTFTLELLAVDLDVGMPFGPSLPSPERSPMPAAPMTNPPPPSAPTENAPPLVLVQPLIDQTRSNEPLLSLGRSPSESATGLTIDSTMVSSTWQAHAADQVRSAPASVTRASVEPFTIDRTEPDLALDASVPQRVAIDLSDWAPEVASIRRAEVRFGANRSAVDDLPATGDDNFIDQLSPLHAARSIVGMVALWWAARAGGMLSSLLIGTPLWRSVDPLPIASRKAEDPDGKDLAGNDDENHPSR
ncbi:MAG: hypothetical protein KDK91_33975, partial [Gammaproteobacteria bacterium]|nr:hypothetical protein [Gammaproteobacteria bacterium]